MISPLRKLQHSETCVFEIHWEIAPLYYTLVLKEKKWILPLNSLISQENIDQLIGKRTGGKNKGCHNLGETVLIQRKNL